MVDIASIKAIRSELGVGAGVATELLLLSGGDIDLAIECSKASTGLDHCKARIINARFERIEEDDNE